MESPEMDIVFKNGSGVRYTGSSMSSTPFNSTRQTPVSSAARDDDEDNMQALERNTVQYLHHRRSTLPNLMNKYIIPKQPRADSKPPSAKKRKKKKKSKTFSLDDEREQERRRQRETEKFLQIYDDLHRIKDYYYQEYMQVLTKKVEKQHKEQKEKQEADERKRLERLEQERLESHRVKKRLGRHNVVHNDTYLHKIPKTELFKIVQLQDQLRKKGNLRYNCELDEFWSAIKKNPNVFNFYLEKLNADPVSQSMMRRRLESAQKGEIKEGTDEGSQLEADTYPTDSSDPTDSWAVTQMYSHQHKGPSPRGTRRQSANTIAKLAGQSLERRCPKMEMPDLHCLNMDLTRKLPDPLEMLKGAEVQAKDHDRKKYLRQLHKMHQLALTHQVAAQRILQKHKDEMDMVFGGPDINDVIDIDFAIARGRGNTIGDRELLPLPAIGSSNSGTRTSPNKVLTPDSVATIEQEKEDDLPSVHITPTPLALTMNEAMDNCKILEAKCTSLFWDNYMRAGKQVTT